MAKSFDFIVLGEENPDLRSHLHYQVIESRTNPFLHLFLDRASSALRHAIAQLSPPERRQIPAFSCIDELNESSDAGQGHSGIQNALNCVYQIGQYIKYAGSIDGQRSMASQTCVVGFSTGLLPAAAIALSPSIPTLIPLAVEITLVSFRLGLFAHHAASHLESDDSREIGRNWSFKVSGLAENDVQNALIDFNSATSTPRSNQAYLGVISNDCMTICGPPTVLERLLCSSESLRVNQHNLPIYSPFHAPHLHSDVQSRSFLYSGIGPPEGFWNSYELVLPLISTTEGQLFNTSLKSEDLLGQIIEQILIKQMSLGNMIDGCVTQLASHQCEECRLVICGRSSLQAPFLTAVQLQGGVNMGILDLQKLSRPHTMDQSTRTSRKPKLAIVGMAGRFPDAADHESFWSLLEQGLDLHRKVPKDRFDVEKHYDPSGKVRNTSHTPYGCFIDEPGLFDPRFFNMSPREATQTDPMHRLGLASAYEALEMAGYVPNRTPSTRLDRIGTFYGQTSDDWREINAAQDVDTYFITGGVRAFAPGRINYFFKFTGPSFSIDTACSSSAAAMQLACTSLWAGDCDTAVIGGLNVMTNSDIFSGLSRGQFLSKTGNCKTYDNDADGYCRGDGIGSIIVKRLEDAEADNDRILGLILETSTNHSANAVSITHPHAPTQEALFKKVMDDAGIDPHDVNYVEMHGTGTQAGDGTEMTSVTNVFAPASRSGTRRQSLHLGSVKANVGHGEAVSGVTAMIKCLMMMQKGLIPPHCGIKKTINQGFPQDLHARNVHIAFKPTPLTAKDGLPRRIFVNNFSAAGGNTATLLEDAPLRQEPQDDPRGDWVVAVTAKSKSALQANTRRLLNHIAKNSDIRLPDLSYTTTARRIQHNYRIAFSCNTMKQVTDVLAAKIDASIDPVSSVSPNVAFAYTGQGSHYTALGKQLYELCKQFRDDITSFDSIAIGLGFPSFLPLLSGECDAKELSPVIIQLGLCCIQMALTRLWASWGITPHVVIGHSLGDYAALNAAGVFSISDTIYLVGERARLLEKRCTSGSHAMLAIKLSVKLIQPVLAEVPGVEIACVNGSQETVLAGTVHDIDIIAEKFTVQGTKCTKLNVQFAFHSSQVDPILAEFEQLAQNVNIHKPSIPVISPLLSTVLSDVDSIKAQYLSRHAREPVNFIGGLASAQQLGFINDRTVFVEIGPHPVCLGFIKSELGNEAITAPSLRRNVMPYKTISESLSALHLAGLTVDWNEYHKDFISCLRTLHLPAYAFDNKNYWIQYTGDWNLHKGQIVGLAALPEAAKPQLSTTTIQKIVSEVVDIDKATVVTESDISRPDLFAAICGHVVNGTALCPSSIYGDMAMTVGEHLYKLLRPEAESVHTNVCNMEVFKPFIANTDNGGKGQTIRLTATLDLASAKASLFFSSGSGKGEVQHAKCHVDYGLGTTWLGEWQRSAYLIAGRINSLKKAATSGAAHRMLRGMAYKLFGAFVEYDSKFRGMEEVILDSPELEATAHIAFQTTEADGKFLCSPYWIDSVCHLAGFIVNANDAVDSSKQVYVSHGWESMRFAEPLRADKTYRSYVKMQPLPGNMVAGDVYILDGDRIIGMCGALKFQCIPRTLLNTFLPPRGVAQKPAAAKPAASKPVQAPRKAANTKTVKPMASKASARTNLSTSVTTQVLDIIAAEVGMPVIELADPIDFANIGVDSLMSLTISGRVREELDIDCQSAVFVDYPTVGALKGYLSQYDTTKVSFEELDDDSESTGSPSDSESSSQVDAVGTPLSPPGSPGEPSDAGSLSMIVRQTIAEEMEVDMAELLATEDLGAIGMDSLMALSILGMLREKAGLTLSADFLVDNVNIKAIEKALHIGPSAPAPKQPKVAKQPDITPLPIPTQTAAPPTSPSPPTTRIRKPVLPDRSASSVLLQGSPKTADKTFWLIPDGGGAPTSYIFMDEISPKLAVWGLTSPFVKNPEEYLCGVVGIATKFIAEIKRRQPKGPYLVGGWSAGGVISFETCRQLIDMGDVVETLVFIDTPCPLIIEPLPGSIHRFFGSIGLLGDGEGALEKLPPWLLPHFAASVSALSTYDAVRIPSEKCPKVYAMWCEDGVCKYPEDPKPDPYPYGHAQWLLENRTDFGPNLWDEFVDGSKLVTRHMAGNHFSMMKAPHVEHLTTFLREALMT